MSAMKVVAPPIEGELSLTIGTFFSKTMTSLKERQLESPGRNILHNTKRRRKDLK